MYSSDQLLDRIKLAHALGEDDVVERLQNELDRLTVTTK